MAKADNPWFDKAKGRTKPSLVMNQKGAERTR